MSNVNLGDEVKDTITGFDGVAVCRDEWLNGCVRIGVQTRELKDGKPISIQWFDESQLEIIAQSASKAKVEQPREGPRPIPQTLADPKEM